MFGLGFGETILIFAVILLFFGPKKVPEAAQSLGKGIREFRRAMAGFGEELMAPQDSVPTTPAPPPHATLAGTGADPHAFANTEPAAFAPVAETPVGEPAAAASIGEPVAAVASEAPSHPAA
jgi:TatA/E family protein of Tat protein translocase